MVLCHQLFLPFPVNFSHSIIKEGRSRRGHNAADVKRREGGELPVLEDTPLLVTHLCVASSYANQCWCKLTRHFPEMAVYLRSNRGGLKLLHEGFEYDKERCFKEKVSLSLSLRFKCDLFLIVRRLLRRLFLSLAKL